MNLLTQKDGDQDANEPWCSWATSQPMILKGRILYYGM